MRRIEFSQIEKFKAKLVLKDEHSYEWDCFVKIKQDSSYYKVNLECTTLYTTINHWVWFKGRHYQFNVINNTWQIPIGRDEEWSCHVFEQCVNLLKKKSKYRLRLLAATERYYGVKGFKPEQYQIPENIEIEENLQQLL